MKLERSCNEIPITTALALFRLLPARPLGLAISDTLDANGSQAMEDMVSIPLHHSRRNVTKLTMSSNETCEA